MNKDEERVVLSMNVSEQITYGKQLAEAIKKSLRSSEGKIKEADVWLRDAGAGVKNTLNLSSWTLNSERAQRIFIFMCRQ